MNEQTKRTVTIFTIVLSLLPCVLLLQFPTTLSARSIALWASAVLGYMGIVMLLWMYILGTKCVMSIIYKDLAPVLKIHKWLGKYGVMAVFLHPILITFSYSESLFYSVIPKAGTVAERHILLGQIALAMLVIVWFSSFFLRKRMAFRPWKYIHYLAYVCVPFALLHVPDLGSQESTHILVKAYLFSLGLIYLAFVALRIRGWLNLDRSRYTVVRHIQLTGLDFMVRLKLQGRIIVPKRGQYVYIKLGFLSEDHPFTVTQYDDTTGELTLTYRIAGMYTKELAKLQEDQEVLLSGPYGTFTSDLVTDDPRPVVYLAGGIGITPFVDRIMNEAGVREQWLFAANRTKSLAVLYEPLKSRLGGHAVAIYSQDDQDLGPNEECGYITADVIAKYIPEPAQFQYYLCGPPAMMGAMRSVVASLGVPNAQVHSEKFGW